MAWQRAWAKRAARRSTTGLGVSSLSGRASSRAKRATREYYRHLGFYDHGLYQQCKFRTEGMLHHG